jgi:hypothetical protein
MNTRTSTIPAPQRASNTNDESSAGGVVSVRDVLVFVPVYRLEPETVAAVLTLEWDGPISWLFQRDNPSGDGYADHLHQYQRGRQAFLAGYYDAMLIVESDIIPPPYALKRLAALAEQDVDLAYGVYKFRRSNVINISERYREPSPRNTGESLSMKPNLLKRAYELGAYPCSGSGLGIVLIKRHVLEAVDFRRQGQAHCDTDFTDDVLRGGYAQWADMTVLCGHKDANGKTVWPVKGKR